MKIGIEIKSIGYTHDYGDLIGDYEKYIREFSEEDLSGLNVLNLKYFSPNTWSSILNNEVFNIVQFKELMELTTYECPYTQRNYTALVPISIWSKDVEKYFATSRNNYIKDMACDKEWNLRDVELSSFKNIELSNIQKLLLGSGYTYGTSINDGSNSVVPVFIDLDNGDLMYAATFVWHNK